MQNKIKSCYIHIPFCNHICSYCDFCKIYYDKKFIKPYLDSLKLEIQNNYKSEYLDTLYIGGGTPSSLSIEELKYLFEIIKNIKLNQNYEFTFECNVESLTKEKLLFLYKNGVNRLSIGVETFNETLLNQLNRFHTKNDVFNIINIAKEIGFVNINIDLIYALQNETIKDLENDLKLFLQLNITHISTYSLIIEPNTKLYIKKQLPIDEDLDYEMYKKIEEVLKHNNYIHYEVSNFSKRGYQSRHNLTYWNNKEYYGFGVGASGFINNIRYDNTRSITNYINNNLNRNEQLMDDIINMQNEMILGLRKIQGVSKIEFQKKYNKKIEEVFNIKQLLDNQKLAQDEKYYRISDEYIYLSNQILVTFL